MLQCKPPSPTSLQNTSPGASADCFKMAAGEDREVSEPSSASREDGEVAAERDGEPDFAKKHPLECKWTLWFDNPKGGGQKQSTWGQTLRAVYTFDTVEDFWWCVVLASYTRLKN